MLPDLPLALLAFAAGEGLNDNEAAIGAAIDAAAAAGARLMLTPETALCGYPGAAREDLHGLDAGALAAAEERLQAQAQARDLVLVLGTASLGEAGWSNDLLVCGAAVRQRYRKRVLTPLDQQFFHCGRQPPALLSLDGWRLGLVICYELRFPRLWGDLAAAGADAFCSIAHMAGGDPDPGTKALVVPAHYCSRAAEWATPVAACNTAASDRWLDSGIWDARGRLQASRGEGLLLGSLQHREHVHRWYAQIHADALAEHRRA